jgi:AcrR family transcriptional regulator
MKTKNREKFNTLTQRQKKFAKTKTALLNVLLEELETKELSTIMIKKLTQMAEVSEPTFFNYFDSKQHMLVYFIQMWSIEMQEIAIMCQNETSSSLEAIKKIFIKTAEQISLHPQIMLEIIAFQTQDIELKPHDISDGEKWLFFEDIEDVELIEGMGLESILPPLILQAVKNGELKKEIDVELLFLILSSLFFGTSLLVLKRDAKVLSSVFEAELNLIFEKVKS